MDSTHRPHSACPALLTYFTEHVPSGALLVVANGRVFPFLMAASRQVLSGFAPGDRAAPVLTLLLTGVLGPELTCDVRDMH